MFVADKWLIVGLIMTAIGILSWVVRPVVRLTAYLLFNPRLHRCRRRALGLTFTLLIGIATVLGFLPITQKVYAPGVVEAVPHLQVVNRVSGYVLESLVQPGQRVEAGGPLLRLENRELQLKIESAEAKLEEIEAFEQQALGEKIADLDPIRKRLKAVKENLLDLRQDERDLIVMARGSGIWISPRVESLVGRWVERGHNLGAIVGEHRFRFSAVVPQAEAAEVFDGRVSRVEVRVWGEADRTVDVKKVELIPYQQKKLPSPALGWLGGGEVPVNLEQSEDGSNAAEPFFLVHAQLQENPSIHLVHGRSGKIRFSLAPKPLMIQWSRRLYQVLQKRYRL